MIEQTAHSIAEFVRHGLKYRPESLAERASLVGSFEGRRIRVVGSEDVGLLEATVHTAYVPSLDLGLVVNARGVVSAIVQSFRETDPFSEYYEIAADEPARARALLVPELREALLEAKAALTDSEVSSVLENLRETSEATVRMPPTQGQLEEVIERALRIGDLVNKLRRAVPPATALADHARLWSELADRKGLEFSPTPLGVTGLRGRTELKAIVERLGPKQFRATVHSQFGTPLGLGIDVRKRGGLQRVGARIGRSSRSPFSRAFRVWTQQEGAETRVLDGRVCEALLRWVSLGLAPEIDDRGLSVSFNLRALAPEVGASVVEELANVGEWLLENAAEQRAVGPYR